MISILVLAPLVSALMAMNLVIGMLMIFFLTLTFVISMVTGALMVCFMPVMTILIILFS